MLSNDPPPGVAAWPSEEKSMDHLDVRLKGPEGSPYESGTFELKVSIPNRYPLEPPSVRFVTSVYHPNIDSQGRICLDSLKMPPGGAWQPSLNVPQVLSQIRLLLAEPNPDDPLMPEISEQFRTNKAEFERHARSETLKFATPTPTMVPSAQPGKPDELSELGPPTTENTSPIKRSRETSATTVTQDTPVSKKINPGNASPPQGPLQSEVDLAEAAASP